MAGPRYHPQLVAPWVILSELSLENAELVLRQDAGLAKLGKLGESVRGGFFVRESNTM